MIDPEDIDFDRQAEILADRALQGLTPLEQSEIDQLDQDFEFEAEAVTKAEALAFEIAVAEAALALEPRRSEALPESLRKRVENDARAFFPAPSGTIPRRSVLARSAPWLGWAAAAALLVVVGSGWLRSNRERPIVDRLKGLTPVKLSATDHPLARGAGGSLVWSGDGQEGYLSLNGLAEVEPRTGVYQLWIFDASRDDHFPVDGGTFRITESNQTTVVPIHPSLSVREPTLFAVTLEPPGGVVVSDRKRIVLTAKP